MTTTVKRRTVKDGRTLTDVMIDGKFVGYVHRERVEGERRGERWAWRAAVRFEPSYLNTFRATQRDAVADVVTRFTEQVAISNEIIAEVIAEEG